MVNWSAKGSPSQPGRKAAIVSQREGKGSAKEEISWAACENVANQPMRISAENAIRRLGAQLVEKNV